MFSKSKSHSCEVCENWHVTMSLKLSHGPMITSLSNGTEVNLFIQEKKKKNNEIETITKTDTN